MLCARYERLTNLSKEKAYSPQIKNLHKLFHLLGVPLQLAQQPHAQKQGVLIFLFDWLVIVNKMVYVICYACKVPTFIKP